MARRVVAAAIGAALTAGALFVGAWPVGQAPALGPLLDPVHGVWALAARARFSGAAHAKIPALQDSVDIRYDDRGVPHIYARNELDAVRALGYVV
ncbi:MAG TPA: penicillin acylase family protein, partial [Gemmatimonadaceae bacterium]|nr:penicillin acylase family protein [Gemmatimonadaceae bacterium]